MAVKKKLNETLDGMKSVGPCTARGSGMSNHSRGLSAPPFINVLRKTESSCDDHPPLLRNSFDIPEVVQSNRKCLEANATSFCKRFQNAVCFLLIIEEVKILLT